MRLITLIINSTISNKKVFQHELFRNASDACDKERFLPLNSGSAAAPYIYIKAEKYAGLIVIEDEGVDMKRQDLIKNLGSIATSGTFKFLDPLGKGGSSTDVSFIRRFVVGFYSSYIVADQVRVFSKSYTNP